MTLKRTNPDFLNGVPELLVLSLLARRPMYGYQLVQAICRSTDGTLEFGEGCIYPILHRLEAGGLLRASRETFGGRSRVVYCVTAQGKKRLAGSTTGWRAIVEAVEQVLQGGEHGEAALA
ncbi:MAG: PadR family transcriptional regulator [Thermoguttaceae bacterium]